jgi:hypothetical protein
LDSLARHWISAPGRDAVTRAGDAIDELLGNDASLKGCNTGRGVRQLIVAPLIAEFTVDEDDRMVTIWAIRHIGELANGH